MSPSVSYWNPTTVREDTRIPAMATDVTRYEFRAPETRRQVTVQARLIFRRAFKELDAGKALKLLRPLTFDDSHEIVPGVHLRFRRAGHLLGAASLAGRGSRAGAVSIENPCGNRQSLLDRAPGACRGVRQERGSKLTPECFRNRGIGPPFSLW